MKLSVFFIVLYCLKGCYCSYIHNYVPMLLYFLSISERVFGEGFSRYEVAPIVDDSFDLETGKLSDDISKDEIEINLSDKSKVQSNNDHNETNIRQTVTSMRNVFDDIKYGDVYRVECSSTRTLYHKSFPLTYGMSFYRSMCSHKPKKPKLYTLSARHVFDEKVRDRFNNLILSSHEQGDNKHGQFQLTDLPDVYNLKNKPHVLLGSVAARLVQLDFFNPDQPYLEKSKLKKGCTSGYYVMTLATDAIARRLGIAGNLLNILTREVSKDPSVGFLYLHVLTNNEGGIKFYEKAGFSFNSFLRRFYYIDGEYFDAYVFVKYIGTDVNPLSDRERAQELVNSIIKAVNTFLMNWVMLF